jgi:RNA polymerase sigma-70 factor (ECF subfamily)
VDTEFLILIDRAKSGEHAALERLLLTDFDPLLRHIQRRLPSSIQGVISPADVLQQSFIQVFRNIRQFKGDSPAAFFAWLKTIAERAVKDAIKAAQRKKRGVGFHQLNTAPHGQASTTSHLIERLSHTGATPSQSVSRREVVQAVQIAMAALPEDYQKAVRLRYFDGKSVQQAADAMGKSPGALRGLIVRAKEKLRAAMVRLSVYI